MATLASDIVSGPLTVQEVSNRTGLSAHTLRYYERAGLLAPVNRSDGGARRYSQRDIDGLLFITRLRLTGMPIRAIRRYVDLVHQGTSTMGERQAILETHRKEVLAQIEHLHSCLAAVDYKIELYKQGWVPSEGGDPCLDRLRQLCISPSLTALETTEL